MTPDEKNLVRSVSRSFYLSLAILPERVRPVMAMGYLLCRAADTVADTDVVPRENRLETLTRIRNVFSLFPINQDQFHALMNELVSAHTLTESSGKTFAAMPQSHQAFLQRVVTGVAEGMIMDLETFGDSAENAKAFRTDSELETYIGWIGGEPGRFWTSVLLHNHLFPPDVSRERVFDFGIAFGKGLQMVNILKDLPEDLKRGRCYLPEQRLQKFGLTVENLVACEKTEVFLTLYHQMIDETVKRLENGLFYIDQLRWWDGRLRAAVWWPLALGLKTLSKLRQTPDVLSGKSKRKIERKDVYKTLASSFFLLPSGKGLRWEFERLSE